MNFERGQDPVKAIGLGKESILREIGGLIVSEEEAEKGSWKKAPEKEPWFSAKGDLPDDVNVVIQVEDGRYEVLRNIIGDGSNRSLDMDFPVLKGLETDLFDLLKKLLDDFRKYGVDLGWAFPMSKKVATKTLGANLVSVQPMPGPVGSLFYIDYKYKNKNLFQRILKKIMDAIRKSARY